MSCRCVKPVFFLTQVYSDVVFHVNVHTEFGCKRMLRVQPARECQRRQV